MMSKGRKSRSDQSEARWSKTRELYDLDQVIEHPPNGEFRVNVKTTIRTSAKASVHTERHGDYIVYSVSGAVYTILESRTPEDVKVRYLYTELTPEDLERRGYL